jgi:alkylation response protein AidB-like acyl-CoA dehydrogenase
LDNEIMKTTPHPSAFIDRQLVDRMRQYTSEAEELKSLHPQQLAIIYEQGWFKLFVPEKYGGLELSLPDALKIEEGLAWTDGSLGWTVTLCGGANWFVGFINEEIATNIFTDKKVCLAGSGKTCGTAKITDDGYEITGQWNYATGSTHATAFTANCIIEKDGKSLENNDGTPMIKAFLLPKEKVNLHKSWEYIGMAATASNSFEVSRLKVPEQNAFIINKDNAVLDQPIYQYPFLNFAEATLAVNNSGMAFRFLDLYEALISEKENDPYARELSPTGVQELNNIKEQFKKARQDFFIAIDQSWKAYLVNDIALPEKLQLLSQTSRALATNARKLVDELYPYCGLAAAVPQSEINRVWRNLHTVSQHPLLLSYIRS